MRGIPLSLLFFVLTAIVFALQAFPVTGIVLMFMLAPFWSVALINAGMIGIAVEALSGRSPRIWLLLPIAFYGGYAVFAAMDRAALADLRARYDAANARVRVPFDPAREALVFNGDGGTKLVESYGLPVVYAVRGGGPDDIRATRLIDNATCAEVRDSATMRAAHIWALWFHDADGERGQRFETRFCTISMPERPRLPQVRVTERTEATRIASLPVTRVTTTIATPNGGTARLSGGVAAPLHWLPMPVIGCMLNSGAARWQCDAAFWRSGFTPIVSGDTRYGRDLPVLARALGLLQVAPADRRAGDPAAIRARLDAVQAQTLARQVAAVRRMAADPLAEADWDVAVLANRPAELDALAGTILAGLERAAAVGGDDLYKAREGGRVLAGLVARFAPDRFVAAGPRLVALYRAAPADARGAPHWLWQSEALLRRIGDLGPAALFVATDDRASRSNVNGAGIEAMCRIGAAGRTVSGPVLLARWRSPDRLDRDVRRALYVALRRVGIDPPALVETAEERTRRERGNAAFGGIARQRLSPMAELAKDWGDVTPASPPRVCAPGEEQARREERYSGRRRTNLE